MNTIEHVRSALEQTEEVGQFADWFTRVAEIVTKNAELHGFHDANLTKGDRMSLMHSEISEMLEAVREGDPESVKCPGISNEVEELADLVIRAMDYSIYYDLPLAKAILMKAAYNVSRPYKHGKAF